MRALMVLFCLLAAPASALEPARCIFDLSLGRFLAEDEVEQGAIEGVFPEIVGKGFVMWEVAQADRMFLQHCLSGQELQQDLPRGSTMAAVAFRRMVYGEAPHTLAEIGAGLELYGLSHQLTQGALGRCACDEMFGGS